MEKIVVIGTGFICEYMRNGMKAVTESDDLSRFVYGIKGTDNNVEKRRKELGFGIGVDNTIEMLVKINPSIIILCCSPEAAQYVVDKHLAPYYSFARLNGVIIPDLYSFIPSPSAVKIHQDLGGKVNVAKILPNIMDKVCGYDMSSVGINYVTYRDDSWSEDRKDVLRKFLSPYGFSVSINDRDSLVLLTGKITSHICYEVSYDISDVCNENGFSISVNDIGNAMINAQYKIIPEMPHICNVSDKSIPSPLKPFFPLFMQSWYDGIRKFTSENACIVSQSEAEHTDMCSFALNVFPIRHETREQLRKDTKNAATKGGILERGIEYYMSDVSQFIKDGVNCILNGSEPVTDFYTKVSEKAFGISKEAFIRSINLTSKK